MMAKNLDKLKRSSNFSFSERSLLIKIAVKKKAVLENKKTDAITWRQKDEEWNKIEKEFNSYSNGEPRNAKQLKNKYEAIKKELKKRRSANLKYIKGTGGGQYKPPSPPKTEEETELLNLISLSVEGLQSQYDSDGLACIPGQSIDMVDKKKENQNLEIEDDWTSSSAALWQTPKHNLLKSTQGNIYQLSEDDQTECETIEIMMVDDDDEGEEILDACSLKDVIDFSGNQPDTYNEIIRDKAGMSKDTGTTNKKVWSSRRRPILPKKKNMSSVSSKFEIVAEKKLELIGLQQDHLLAKIKQDQEQHEINMEILKLKLEKEKATGSNCVCRINANF